MKRCLALAAALVGCAPPPLGAPLAPAVATTEIADAASSAARGAPPACAEEPAPGPWPRPSGVAEAVAGAPGYPGYLAQPIGGSARRLRFLGAHLFDLLDKLEHEGGTTELDRRRVVCAALNAAAATGAPVVRIWGTLKRTGTAGEVDRAADLLALVLDEDARRARPLRFIVTLMNHQGGYGAPRPDASLDDQDPSSPWSARRVYLEGAWRARGVGQLEERIERLRARPEIVASPLVLAWELVNELDTHRAVAAGSLTGPEADALRDRFLVPALSALAAAFPQPIMLGDLRGTEAAYVPFARGVVAALAPAPRARLVWTSHVYAPVAAGPADLARAVRKLDLDLAIATEHGLPFILGELGQHAPGPARFCGDGAAHDPARLFAAVLDAPAHRSIEAALFWGEGHCDLPVPGAARRIAIGAGGDSADLAPRDAASRAAVRTTRGLARFSLQ